MVSSILNGYKRPAILFYFSLCLLILAPGTALGQSDQHPFGIGSADHYRAEYQQSRTGHFSKVFTAYNNYLQNHPGDIVAHAERCRFIDHFAYDDEGYVLVAEAAEFATNCADELLQAHPAAPEALILEMESLYGEEALVHYQQTMASDLGVWSQEQLRRYTNSAANNSSWLENEEAGLLAAKAFEQDHSEIHLGLTAARYFFSRGDGEQALQILDAIQFESTDSWAPLRKLRLLIEYEKPQQALAAYVQFTETYHGEADDDDLAKLNILLGKTEQALTKVTSYLEHGYGGDDSGKQYFQLALRQPYAEQAKTLYEFFRDRDYLNDPLLYHRWQLQRAFPELPWTWSSADWLRVLNWLAVLTVCIAMPLLLIIPIHYRSLIKQRSGWRVNSFIGSWNLKHVWFYMAIYIFVSAVAIFIWDYTDLEAIFFSAEGSIDSLSDAALTHSIFFVDTMILLALAITIGRNWRIYFLSTWSPARICGMVVLAYVLLRLLTIPFVTLRDSTAAVTPDVAQTVMLSVYNTYGLGVTVLTIGVITAIIEETLFRGLLLCSLVKHLNFASANLIQAGLFAAIHEDTYLFGFYVVFGLVTGYFVKASKSLAPSILLHALNNTMACLAVTYVFKNS